MDTSTGICGSSTTITSAPPFDRGASGHPSFVQKRIALSIPQSSTTFWLSALNRSSALATPWRMLWLVLVIRKTAGFGLGTDLDLVSDAPFSLRRNGVTNLSAYHEQSTPCRSKYLRRAWRIRATPPPRGVALKNAMPLLRSLTIFAYFSVRCFVSGVTSFIYC